MFRGEVAEDGEVGDGEVCRGVDAAVVVVGVEGAFVDFEGVGVVECAGVPCGEDGGGQGGVVGLGVLNFGHVGGRADGFNLRVGVLDAIGLSGDPVRGRLAIVNTDSSLRYLGRRRE